MRMLEDLAEVASIIDTVRGIPPGSADLVAGLRVEAIACVTFIRTHHATIRDTAKRLEAAERDAARMDFLVSHNVEVRRPARYGSLHYFTAQALTDEEDDVYRTSLREQIDAAMQETGR